MGAISRYAIRRVRGQILGWGIGLGLLALMLVSMYDSIARLDDQLEAVLQGFPAELQVFVGGLTEYGTPEGFLAVEFFSYMPLILGIFAISLGSGLLVADEEAGILDLIAAYPLSRQALFWGRWLASVGSLILVCLLTWVAFVVSLPLSSSLNISPGRLARPMVALLVQLLLFDALALFLSLLLPSRRAASMVSGLLLVASFFVTGLGRLNETVEEIARFSPLTYYQTVDAFDGLNLRWIGALVATALAFTAVSAWAFERRDIRVGGERGWRWPRLHLRRASGSVGGTE